jgi:hypothetical protein
MKATTQKKKSAPKKKVATKKKSAVKNTPVKVKNTPVRVKKSPARIKKTTTKTVKAAQKKEDKPKTLIIDNKPEFFEGNGYLPVKDFLSADLSRFLYTQLLMKVERGEYITDQQSPDQPAWAGESFLDAVLVENQKKVEELVGLELYPTYTYARMYNPGAILEPHKDRPACEVSLTCTLGFEGEAQALFFCADKKPTEELPAGELTNEEVQKERLAGNPTKIILSNPGDAALYKGCEMIHWRDVVKNTRNLAQVFLHYVAKNGANSSSKYDGRSPNAFLKGPLD